jgi:hypothetical protein
MKSRDEDALVCTGHMIAIDPPIRLLVISLASKRPSTHAPTPARNSERQIGGQSLRQICELISRDRGN